MQVTRERPIARPLLWVALLAIVVALVRFSPDLARREQPVPAREADVPRSERRTDNAAVPAVPSAAPTAPLASLTKTAPEPSSGLAATTDITLRAPAIVDPGETFAVRLHVSAPNGMDRLQLTVRFDKKMLTLAGVSEGDFPMRTLLPVDFAVDEPSEGNLQIGITVRNGIAATGAGTIAVIHFEARKAGTVTIAVSNVSAFDNAGSRPLVTKAPQAVSVRIR